MTNDKDLVPEKASVLKELMKTLLRQNCKYMDSEGNVNYFRYPSKKGFTAKQHDEIRTLEITNVETIDNQDTPLDDLRNLRYLEKLILGDGVKGINKYAIPTTVTELVLSDSVTNIPEGYVAQGSIKRISGNGYSVDVPFAHYNSTFHIDEFGRLNISTYNHISSAQYDAIEKRGTPVKEAVQSMRNAKVASLFSHTEKHSNTKTIYVYAHDIDSARDYSIITVVDDYPMDSTHKTKLPDSDLIAILINGVDEVDLDELPICPNLQTIYIGREVKKVKGISGDVSNPYLDTYEHKYYTEKTTSGKERTILFTSKKTTHFGKQSKRKLQSDIKPKTMEVFSPQDNLEE